MNNQFIQAMARTTLGSVLARLGRLDQARSNLHQAMEMWEYMGLHAYRWTTVQYLAALLAVEGDDKAATKLLAASKRAGRRSFGPGLGHWADMVDDLENMPEFETWSAEGSELSLAEASALALASTQPHR